jgi:hypothetical protein
MVSHSVREIELQNATIHLGNPISRSMPNAVGAIHNPPRRASYGGIELDQKGQAPRVSALLSSVRLANRIAKLFSCEQL